MSASRLVQDYERAELIVKAKLLPLPRWKAVLEQLLEWLPRRLYVPRVRPLSQVVSAVQGESQQWFSSGDDPAFLLDFEGGEVPHGWVYLEAALQRSMGSRVARIRFDRGRGFDEHEGEFVPSNMRGSIRELIFIPSDVVGLRWDPCEARGYFSQTPLVFNRVGAIERVVRMADRVFAYRELLSQLDVGNFVWLRHGLVSAYLQVRRCRYERVSSSYKAYILTHERFVFHRLQESKRSVDQLTQPLFIVHIGFGEQSDRGWEETLASLRAQTESCWLLVDWRSPRLSPRFPVPGQPNVWHILLRAGDILIPSALLRLGRHILDHPDALVAYSDHDFLDDNGHRCCPSFKPDWNLDLYYTHNYLANLCAVSWRANGANEVFSAQPSAAAFVSLVLAASQSTRNAITHLPLVLCHRQRDPVSGDPCGGEPSQLSALSVHGPLAAVRIDPGLVPGTCRIIWPLPALLPRVTVIIPTRDRIDLLSACVSSLIARTTYPEYDVLVVDNDSKTPEAATYFLALEKQERFRVLPYEGRFNYSAINNSAASQAEGSLLLFLNNDTEVIEPEWMTDMVRHAIRPGVGAVGAKLLYSDGCVQHAGVVMGIGGVAGHVHRFLPGDKPGYGGRAVLAHSFTALTGACLMVRKELFEEVGGFNAQELVVACNDVDLCLKLHRLGLRNILEPSALLYHHESMTRGVDDTPEKRSIYEREREYMTAHWPIEIQHDPAYNQNLSRDHEDFSVRTDL